MEMGWKIDEYAHIKMAKMISTYHPADVLQHGQIHSPRRSKGRPRLRWEDDINSFCRHQGFSDWNHVAQHHRNQWHDFTRNYVDYCLNE